MSKLPFTFADLPAPPAPRLSSLIAYAIGETLSAMLIAAGVAGMVTALWFAVEILSEVLQ